MKVLFAVDGSPGSLAAVRQTGQWLQADRDEAAFYFAPPELIVRHAAATEEMQERARTALCATIFNEARVLLPPALAAKAVNIVAEHTAAEGVVIEAQKWNADLIVVGARGLSTLEHIFLGSVSNAIAQSSPVPVLVVRPQAQHRVGQPLCVVYAYDGSAGSTAALAVAEKFNLPAATHIVALTVIEALTAGEIPQWLLTKARDADTEAMSATWLREHEAEKRQACDQLGEFMGKQPAPFSGAEVVCAEGHAAQEVLRVVQEKQGDLVVIGTHGKSLLERIFIGSTSSKVLNQAPCSVLIARGK